jgi:hypothetical protein
VWSLASPQPEMDPVLAGTPFESPFDRLTVLSNVEGLTALRKIEGVARPTVPLNRCRFVGSATVPTKERGRFPIHALTWRT